MPEVPDVIELAVGLRFRARNFFVEMVARPLGSHKLVDQMLDFIERSARRFTENQ